MLESLTVGTLCGLTGWVSVTFDSKQSTKSGSVSE